MNTTIVIYSHTENSDIWGYIQESMRMIDKKHRKLIAVEKPDHNELLSEFNDIIVYDDSWTYDKKLLHILSSIDTEYMVLVHDNDLIVSFDNTLLDVLLDRCKTNNIDRCMFGVVARDTPIKIEICDGHRIGQVNNIKSCNFELPYDVGPSIWKVESYRAALHTIPNTHYRDIEQSHIQHYCNTHLNMCGFLSHASEPSSYVIGRPFCHKFQFLHIFVRRQLMETRHYMDQKGNLLKILERYPDILKRGTLLHQNHINITSRPV
jgi:hypothetical protein